jgi:lysyl-tRNA synthetase class 2
MPSSVIRSFDYDDRTRALDVLFVSGLRYRYSDVPEDIALGLAAAPSKGVYFNNHIRDSYAFERRRSRG